MAKSGSPSPQALAAATRPSARSDRPVLREVSARAPLIDPVDQSPDPELVRIWGPQRCLQTGLLPWRKVGGYTVILATDRAQYDTHRAELTEHFGPTVVASAQAGRVHQAIQRIADPILVHAAERRTSDQHSCRDLRADRVRRLFLAIIIGAAAWAIYAPKAFVIMLSIWATLASLSSVVLKLFAALSAYRDPRAPSDPPLASQAPLPVITVLVPLFREEHIAEHLMERLRRLNYPRDRLDIILVTERADMVTQKTIAKTEMPPWFRCITVPRGGCQTKPRAMNYALDFARGDIIGVYDAEDAPHPDQLLVVARRFAVSPPSVVCLQGILDFYNPKTNWLSRCFTIEYATWFRVVLPGIEKLGLIIPLGGTTLFFRRHVLEKLGAWDAHNVTEDADLGVRLARHGYRTAMIPTVTEEEANARIVPWIKQRSRWLKGYAVTYWVHMRTPVQFWRDVGAARFMGFQLQFATTLSTFLLVPVLWSFWLALLGMYHPFMEVLGQTGVMILALAFLLSEVLTISLSMLGANRSGRPYLMKWAVSMHLYYPLAAFACYKAFWELASRPFYWDKTAHGIFAPTKSDKPAP